MFFGGTYAAGWATLCCCADCCCDAKWYEDELRVLTLVAVEWCVSCVHPSTAYTRTGEGEDAFHVGYCVLFSRNFLFRLQDVIFRLTVVIQVQTVER